MSNLQKRKEGGFTIIEVLIVLAIAGLIMLIVFLAVPALQRNSRNTQRTNDVSAVLSGMTEYVNNNNGSLPATATGIGTSGTTTGTIGASGTNTTDVKLGYYDPSKINIVAAGNVTNPNNQETMTIVKGAKCSGNDATTTGASGRGFVALYTLENNSKQCKES